MHRPRGGQGRRRGTQARRLGQSGRLPWHLLLISCQFTASMWTEEQANKAVSEAKSVNPSIKVLSLPHGYQQEKGPDATVSYIIETLPKVLG